MNIIERFKAHIMLCFAFYDTPTETPPTSSGDIESEGMTMEGLLKLMKEQVVEVFKNDETIKKFREAVDKVTKKNLFPDSDPDTGESDVLGGSIIDTKCFGKQYSNDPRFLGGQNEYNKYENIGHKLGSATLPAGMVFGKQLMASGGPFLKLSPEMETFARILKYRGDAREAASNYSFDIYKYNDNNKCNYKQAGMSEGTAADGGNTVPIEFLATVIEFAVAQSAILSRVWRMPMGSNSLRIPRLAQSSGSYFGGITMYSPGEGEVKTSSKPQFEQIEFVPKKRYGLVYLTDELIADSMINIVNYVVGLFTRALQYDMENRVLQGAASATIPAVGIIADPLVTNVNRQTAATVTFQDIVNLDSQIDEAFGDNLEWAIRKLTQNTLISIVDLNNRPIYMVGYEAVNGTLHPNAMYGYPVHKTRNVPALGAAGDIVLGNFAWYMIAMRQEMTVAESEHVRFIYDEHTVRLGMRYDGRAVVPEAFTYLDSVAT